MVLIFFGMLLAACSDKEGQLTRVDVQKVTAEGTYEEISIITEKEKIDLIKDLLKYVKWDPNTIPSMARNEDLFATLFYTFDKNMPERLYEYHIWFNENHTATIISNHEKEGYGKLEKEYTKKLKDVLSKT